MTSSSLAIGVEEISDPTSCPRRSALILGKRVSTSLAYDVRWTRTSSMPIQFCPAYIHLAELSEQVLGSIPIDYMSAQSQPYERAHSQDTAHEVICPCVNLCIWQQEGRIFPSKLNTSRYHDLRCSDSDLVCVNIDSMTGDRSSTLRPTGSLPMTT